MLAQQATPGEWLTVTRGPYVGETFQLTQKALDTETYTIPCYTYKGGAYTNFDLRRATAEEIAAAREENM